MSTTCCSWTRGDVAHVVLFVGQEAAENVDSEDSEPLGGLNAHNCLDTLCKDRVSGVFRCFSVGGDLSENIRHFISGFRVFAA